MSQIPANQKMWSTLVAQARARGWKWPSPTAANWVHQHYVQLGGKFVQSERDIDPRFRNSSPQEIAKKRREAAEAAKRRKKKGDSK